MSEGGLILRFALHSMKLSHQSIDEIAYLDFKLLRFEVIVQSYGRSKNLDGKKHNRLTSGELLSNDQLAS